MKMTDRSPQKLGTHPHKLGRFGLADSSDSKANFLDS